MKNFKLNEGSLLAMMTALPIGVLLVDSMGQIVFANEKFQQLLGYTIDELTALSANDLIPARLRLAHSKSMQHFMTVPTARPMHAGRLLPAIKKNGDELHLQIGLTPIVQQQQDYVLVSAIEAQNQVLKVTSPNDALTGLPGRALFNEVSENLRRLALRNSACFGVMFIDLDKFKQVNDDLGHHAGDVVLHQVAEVLTKNLRKNDIVGRVGGDEFVVSLYGIESQQALVALGNKLIREISSIDQAEGKPIDIGASIGAVFVAPPLSHTLDELTDRADVLMYEAKRAGKGTLCAEAI